MAGPAPELSPLIESLPSWLQGIVTGALGIGALIGGAIVYLRRLAKEDAAHSPEKAKDFVIQGMGLADSAPFKEMAAHLSDLKVEGRETRLLMQRLVTLAEEDQERREQDREVAQRVEAEILKRERERERRDHSGR